MTKSTALFVALIVGLSAALTVQSIRLKRLQAQIAGASPNMASTSINSEPPINTDATATLQSRAQVEGAGGEGNAPSVVPAPQETAFPTGATHPDEEDFSTNLVNNAIEALFNEGAAGNPDRYASLTKSEAKALRKKEKKEQAYTAKDGPKGHVSAKAAEHSDRLVNQAKTALKSGDFAQAEALLTDSLEKDPYNRNAYKTLAQMQQKMGLSDAAMQTYQDWQEAMPKDALPHYQQARAYEQLGQDEQAYAALQQFASLNGETLSAYPMMSDMYGRLGLRDEQGATLESWVNAAGDSPDAHRALGDYYRRTGNYGAALNEYERVAGIIPESSSAYANMGNTYQRLRQYENAQMNFETALELRPGDINVRQQLANSYRISGNAYAAIDTYQSIIALEPGSRQAQQATRHIVRLERRLNQ